MQIEIEIDERCQEPKIIIRTDKITDEVGEIVKRLSAQQPKAVAGFRDGTVELLEPDSLLRVYTSGGKVLAQTEDSLTVSMTAERFAQDVCLTLLSRNARYSDNAFDMDAGETRMITAWLPANEQREKPLRISALNAAPQLVSWTNNKKEV